MGGRPSRFARSVAAIAAAAALAAGARASTEEFRWQLPAGFPEPAVPAENPMSTAKVALGAKLFADPRLSMTGQHSCASCHAPERAFTDGLARSRGATGAALPLNAPTLLNVAYNSSLGWRDANLRTLEQQMRGPLFNEHPHELGLAGREALVERELSDDGEMTRAFAAAFPGEERPISIDNVIRAIAAYERTLFAGNSAFDRYVFRGEHRALSDRQKAGMQLFYSERTGCARCHGGVNFTGAWVDRDHPSAESVFADTGTGVAVRVPTLRNLPATAPYMHDGRFPALDQVLDHYERMAQDPAADARLRRAPLTTAERESLREFLLSLTDRR
ncbi:MAG TPA: cytochrome c peroxidase [Steroidobacteraceae bacterium]|nr:cytochrome c peroxidase [Steroidobacteraceae bacterium]